jgi:hypothetical protein
MALYSKKELFTTLDNLYQIEGYETFKSLGLKHPAISNENYDDKSFIYIETGNDLHIKRVLTSLLLEHGFEVCNNYAGKAIKVQVSYFI